MTNRRNLIRSFFAASALASLRRFPLADAETAPIRHGSPNRPLARIPTDFIGFGYEMSSVGRGDLLSAKNTTYVNLLRNLGSKGVLRIGGIVADFTSYSANGPGKAQPKDTIITRDSLAQLRSLLDATGWSAIWSVNFAQGTLEEAVIEAKAVHEVLGSRLSAIELGNEVENYSHSDHSFRKPPYTYENYRTEYDRWRKAILTAVPKLRFAAPDTAASVEWVEKMAAGAHSDVQLLTTHYYRGDQRRGTQEHLLQIDTELIDHLKRLREASRKSGIPWRMCETNSFFGGGRPGVSNTLAGALWTLEFMLLLAAHGCAGVNIETGVNQLGFVSSYSPIQDDGKGHNFAGVPYYGMLAFAAAAKRVDEVLAVELSTDDKSFSTFTLGSGGRTHSIVLINKSATAAAPLKPAGTSLNNATATYLKGPSLDSTNGVTFGEISVDDAGRWTGKHGTILEDELSVPPATAAVVRLS